MRGCRFYEAKNMKFDFIKNTEKFTIIGFIIPRFTAILSLEIQQLLTSTGIECSIALKIIWGVISIIGVVLLIIFLRLS
jgi:hypothetical protein